jgi:hypothetical protein
VLVLELQRLANTLVLLSEVSQPSLPFNITKFLQLQVTSAAIDVAVADTVIAMVIVAAVTGVAVVMTIAAALAMMIMIGVAMAADVTVMIAIAPGISIATKAVGVMIAMEVVVIAVVTGAAIVVVVATMTVEMIAPDSLLRLETNHANLTREAAETMAAATTATQVGRLFHHVSTRHRMVSSEPRAYDSFRPQVTSPSTSRFRFPTCICRLFTRLDWNLETASDSEFAAMKVVGFLLITKATSAIAGSASLSTCIAPNASWIS